MTKVVGVTECYSEISSLTSDDVRMTKVVGVTECYSEISSFFKIIM